MSFGLIHVTINKNSNFWANKNTTVYSGDKTDLIEQENAAIKQFTLTPGTTNKIGVRFKESKKNVIGRDQSGNDIPIDDLNA